MAWFGALIGPVVSAMGSAENRDQARLLGIKGQQQKEYEAQVIEKQGIAALARSSFEALNEGQRAKRVASRFLAVAAFQGGGAADPKTIRLAGDLENEGSYRRAVAIWGGTEQKRQMFESAKLSRWEGERVKEGGEMQARAYQTKAIAYLAQGASTLYQKYAKSGVTTTPSDGVAVDTFGDKEPYFMAKTST